MGKKRQLTRENMGKLTKAWPFIAAGTLSFFFVFLLSFHFTRIHITGPLPVPVFPRLSYSGPLTVKSSSPFILGAATFNPRDVIAEVNRERVNAGSQPLRTNELLMKAAQMRADAIMKRQHFSHYDPVDNIILATVLPKVGYTYAYATENIGMGGASGADFVYGFMHSTSHRENLLNPLLVDTGTGLSTGPFKQYYVNVVVQLFAIPGGKWESLGYTKNDIDYYRKRLGYLKSELNPVTWTLGAIFEPDLFSETRHRQLAGQLTTIKTIYELMKNEQPLTPTHLAMIEEFNGNL